MQYFGVRGLLVASTSLLACTAALAQEVPEAASESAAAPKSVSSLAADLELGFGYDDNVYATENDKVDDTFVIIEPSVSYRLGKGGSSLRLRASGEIAFHDKSSGEDYDDWLLGADGQLDLAKQLKLIAGGSYQWEHEGRASPEDVAGAEPTLYRRAYGYTGIVGRSSRFAFRLGATVSGYDFSDTPAASGIINNDDRDRSQVELGARVGYSLTGGPELFVQGAWDKRHYRREIDDEGFRRASDGFTLAGGLRHELAKGVTAEVFAGLLRQDYDDPALPDIHTIDYGLLVNWTGENNLSGSFRLDRSVEETTLPGASAFVLTSGTLSFSAVAGPRLMIGGSLTGSDYDYRGAARSEFVVDADLWTRYWIDPRIYVGTSYVFSQRVSNAASYDYNQNRLMLRLGVQLQPRYAAGGKDGGPPHAADALDGLYFAALLGHGALATGLDGPRGTGSNTADFGDVGFDFAAALGYGIAFDRLYLGVEVEGSGGGPDWLHSADRTFSVERTGSVSAGLRLGLLTSHNDLIFGRVAAVSTRFRTTYSQGDNDLDFRDWRTGIGFGVGLEAAVGSHGFVRTGYDLISYPDYDVVTASGAADNFSNSEDRFRVGLGIRVGGNPGRKDTPVDFSGAYAGVSLGHGALTSSNQGPRSGGFILDVTRSGQGGLLGGFAGAGFLIKRFYLGGEVHADAGHVDWNLERDPQGRTYSVAHDYSYGASARVGHMLSPSALLYGRVGYVRTRFDTKYETSGASARRRGWEDGLQYGLGLQVGLGASSSLRLEYTFTDYPMYTVAYGHSADDFENYENVLKIGISWKL